MRPFPGALLPWLCLAACAAPQRIPPRADWPDAVKGSIAQGQVQLGFSPDMVEAALGKPARRFTRIAPDQRVDIWSYRRFDLGLSLPFDPLTPVAASSGSAYLRLE